LCFAAQAPPKRADPGYDNRSDLELAAGIARRDAGAVRLVMRRNNQRLFRAAWRILRNHEDAEDAVQSGYLKAFAAIRSFAGRSSLSTWLTRIVTNNALAHVRAARRRRSLLEESEVPILDDYREMLMRGSMSVSPERAVARGQIRQTVADAIDQLPAPFRKVFVLRQIEELDVAEVAEALGIPAATVKTRHLRARRRLQRLLGPGLASALSGRFPFDRAPFERSMSPSVLPNASVGVQGTAA
jgi:RNA polymerase sigma-70 factor (ECF subfamily)